ncbi:MAG TPA: hypothetical protein VMP01_15465 [Pirellulaceae bacterium]|nr:hypothetical protein [Pirellulaceae bacterium]
MGWLLLAFIDPDPPGRLGEYIGIGFFLGTMFGQTTVASAWTAFGPAPLVWRLPLSFLWVVMLAMAIGINVGMRGGPDEAYFVIGACLIGQWFLVQLPLWGLAMGYGLRLRHRDDANMTSDPRERQFGIRQLLIITTIVAVVFGIGRLIVPNLNIGSSGEPAIFIFLAVAAIVITLPLLLASLLPRLALPGTLVTLVLIGLATAWELPMLRSAGVGSRGGPDAMHFVWINAITTMWLLALVLVVRWNGYTLAAPGLGVRK